MEVRAENLREGDRLVIGGEVYEVESWSWAGQFGPSDHVVIVLKGEDFGRVWHVNEKFTREA